MEDKKIKELYDGKTIEMMRVADSTFNRNDNRVEAIRNFAKETGVKRIGIANCITFLKEAEAVERFLSDEFEVFRIDCKCGRISKQEMFGIESSLIVCNPAGQAEFLKENNTELNISMGMCVGHDMIFNQKSASPTTTLVVKDFVNKHNTMESVRGVVEEASCK